MKKIITLCSVLSALCSFSANAADVTLYYSPSCPHCHHARDFINDQLVYEYQTIKANELNVGSGDNMNSFQAALDKCGYDRGGIPVIVIGDKCFQGYADSMKQDLRDAVAADMSDSDRATAAKNIEKFATNPDEFRAANPTRKDAVAEIVTGDQKKNSHRTVTRAIYGAVILAAAVMGIIIARRRKK